MDIDDLALKICKRRAKSFSKLQTITFTKLLTTAIADLAEIISPIANTFYIIESLNVMVSVAQTVGAIKLRLSVLGGAGIGDTGNMDIPTVLTLGDRFTLRNIETDSLLYFKNGSTGGAVLVTGVVHKVTMKTLGAN